MVNLCLLVYDCLFFQVIYVAFFRGWSVRFWSFCNMAFEFIFPLKFWGIRCNPFFFFKKTPDRMYNIVGFAAYLSLYILIWEKDHFLLWYHNEVLCAFFLGPRKQQEQRLFNEFLGKINSELTYVQLELRACRNQYDGNVYYGVVNNVSDDQSKLGTKYTVPQIAFYKGIVSFFRASRFSLLMLSVHCREVLL